MIRTFTVLLSIVLVVSLDAKAVSAEENPESFDLSVSEDGSYSLYIDSKLVEPEIVDEIGGISVMMADDALAVVSVAKATPQDTAVAVAHEGETILSWNFADETKNVEIQYNDVSIEEVAEGTLVLGDLMGDATKISVVQEFRDTADPEVVMYKAATMMSVQPDSSLDSAGLTSTLTAQALPLTSVFRYQTFIQSQYVRAPSLGCEYADLTLVNGDGYFFTGNNRSFLPGSSNNKTAMNVVLNWGSASMQLSKYVQPTYVYKHSEAGGYELVDSKTASSANIGIFNLGMTSSSARFSMSHNAANPYCPFARGIEYSLTVTAQRSGSYSVSGWFRQVPSHEFYYKDSVRTAWDTIFQSNLDSGQGFDCLNPFALDCKINSTWSSLTTTYYTG